MNSPFPSKFILSYRYIVTFLTFVVETNKKVAVVVQEQEEQKPTVKVQMISQPEPKKPMVERKVVEKPIVKNSNELTKRELFDLLMKKK